jgi:hypothetical protein
MITFHVERKTAKLKHVHKWLNLFAYHYNKKKIFDFTEPNLIILKTSLYLEED